MASKLQGATERPCHGTLICVAGFGVLITGPAGIGKSECALGLVAAGHQLVADDVVIVSEREGFPTGRSPSDFDGLLSVRDVGIFDVRVPFGDAAFRRECRIDLQIDLTVAAPEPPFPLFGPGVPMFAITAGKGRELVLLVETIVRLHANGGFRDLDSIGSLRTAPRS